MGDIWMAPTRALASPSVNCARTRRRQGCVLIVGILDAVSAPWFRRRGRPVIRRRLVPTGSGSVDVALLRRRNGRHAMTMDCTCGRCRTDMTRCGTACRVRYERDRTARHAAGLAIGSTRSDSAVRSASLRLSGSTLRIANLHAALANPAADEPDPSSLVNELTLITKCYASATKDYASQSTRPSPGAPTKPP